MQAIRSETVINIKRSDQCNIGTLLIYDDKDNDNNNSNNNNNENSQWTKYCKSEW